MFGGVLRTEKMKFTHKMMANVMTKASQKEGKPLPKPMTEKISRLAGNFK